jgi:hypothetical protein
MEPNLDLHHIFTDVNVAQMMYDALMQDLSFTDEQKAVLEPPRQSHGETWIVDKVRS